VPIAVFEGRVKGRSTITATLLNAVAATGNGEWINLQGFNPATCHAILTGTATVELDGSCEPTQPADATHGFSLNTLTATGAIVVNVPVRWLKARVTAYTSGTVTVHLMGSEDD
jgi:hypothetical protein